MRLKNSPFLQQAKRKTLTRLGKPQNAGPYLKVLPDDVFIVSYPRSGNTWMRFLIGSMVHQEDVDFDNMDRYVPDIYRCTNQFLESLNRPRYLKSHESYDARYPKAIYLVRDPRDVAISYYGWLQKYRKVPLSFDEFVLDFANNRTRYGGWGGNVESWYQNLDQVLNGALLVRYEDLLAETVDKLSEIAVFLSLDISRQRLEEIINKNKFESMRKKEMEAKKANFIKGERDDIRFVRKGTAGQWKDDFSKEQRALFADSFQEIAGKLGYDLTDSAAGPAGS